MQSKVYGTHLVQNSADKFLDKCYALGVEFVGRIGRCGELGVCSILWACEGMYGVLWWGYNDMFEHY